MNESDKAKYFPRTKNDPQLVRQVFGPASSASLASRIARENPALYRELKVDAVSLGILASVEGPKTPMQTILAKSAAASQQTTLSDAEIAARARFSEQECRRLFVESHTGDQNNAANLKKNDPNGYAAAKLAAASYGLLNFSPDNLPQRPVTTGDELVTVSADLSRKANLPEGIKVSVQQLDTIVRSVAAVELAKQKDAA